MKICLCLLLSSGICNCFIIFIDLSIIKHNYLKMMKLSFSFIIFLIISITLVYSCSNEDVESESSTPTQYTLSIKASEGGTISPDANGIYNRGATITVTAAPNIGYVFYRWEGTDNDKPYGCWAGPGKCRTAITMNSNRDVQAFFKSNSE